MPACAGLLESRGQGRRFSVSIGGRTRGSGNESPPAGSRGRAPGGGLATKLLKAHWQLDDVMVSDITFLWFLLFSMCQPLHVAVNKYINWCVVDLSHHKSQ